ncbi:MAG: transcriptional regulator [Thermoprotei archaeon]|nr:transcriptional regulator [Thermoprotei archaeon]
MRAYSGTQVRYELPCERAVRAVFPSIRAILARILTEEYGLSRYSVAKVLGMTPAAVTLYLEKRRGDKYAVKLLSNPEISQMVRKMAEEFFNDYSQKGYVSYQIYQAAFCSICSKVNEVAIYNGCPALDFNGGSLEAKPEVWEKRPTA